MHNPLSRWHSRFAEGVGSVYACRPMQNAASQDLFSGVFPDRAPHELDHSPPPMRNSSQLLRPFFVAPSTNSGICTRSPAGTAVGRRPSLCMVVVKVPIATLFSPGQPLLRSKPSISLGKVFQTWFIIARRLRTIAGYSPVCLISHSLERNIIDKSLTFQFMGTNEANWPKYGRL